MYFSFIFKFLDDFKNNLLLMLGNLNLIVEDKESYKKLEGTLYLDFNRSSELVYTGSELATASFVNIINELKDLTLFLYLLKENINYYILTNYRMFNEIISLKRRNRSLWIKIGQNDIIRWLCQKYWINSKNGKNFIWSVWLSKG